MDKGKVIDRLGREINVGDHVIYGGERCGVYMVEGPDNIGLKRKTRRFTITWDMVESKHCTKTK